MGSPGGDGQPRGWPHRAVALIRPQATRVGTGEKRWWLRSLFWSPTVLRMSLRPGVAPTRQGREKPQGHSHEGCRRKEQSETTLVCQRGRCCGGQPAAGEQGRGEK